MPRLFALLHLCSAFALPIALVALSSDAGFPLLPVLAASFSGFLPEQPQRPPCLTFYNTICRPTRVKQVEIKTLPLHNDAMIIIGSRTSANTRRLFEISKSLNKRAYWIQSKGELKAGWFQGVKSVGIMAGASTPDETTREVINAIKAF